MTKTEKQQMDSIMIELNKVSNDGSSYTYKVRNRKKQNCIIFYLFKNGKELNTSVYEGRDGDKINFKSLIIQWVTNSVFNLAGIDDKIIE